MRKRRNEDASSALLPRRERARGEGDKIDMLSSIP